MDEGKKKSSRRASADIQSAGVSAAGVSDAGNTILFEATPTLTQPTKAAETRRSKPERSARAQKAESQGVTLPGNVVPETVRERFIQIGNGFFFPDGTDAFTDHGNRMSTRSENAVVIQSMVAVAQAREAKQVEVTGTELFKKEAWFAARLVGLEVQGHAPTSLEQERLVRALARRRTQGDQAEARLEQGSENPLAPNENKRPRSPESGREEVISGRLVDHGPARYQHQPSKPMSYYVRIETERGDREVWGVDLERAMRQSLSSPRIGDEIGLRAVERTPVTVVEPKLDSNGSVISKGEFRTHRNEWVLETREFLERRREMADTFRRSDIKVADAIKEFPELEGSYLQLQIARAGAEQRIQSLEARDQFVGYLRSHLAARIEQGRAIEPVHLRSGARPEIHRQSKNEAAITP